MNNFKAEVVCQNGGNSSFEALYTHDRGTKVITVNDDLITTSEVAVERARAELVKGAYVEKWVTLTTVYTPNLKQNDIIFAKGYNWIVKEITISYNPPKLIQNIKAIRYD